jgi:hypothetical protein
MLGQETADQPPINVVAAADLVSDHHLDQPAAIKIRDVVRHRR